MKKKLNKYAVLPQGEYKINFKIQFYSFLSNLITVSTHLAIFLLSQVLQKMS